MGKYDDNPFKGMLDQANQIAGEKQRQMIEYSHETCTYSLKGKWKGAEFSVTGKNPNNVVEGFGRFKRLVEEVV